MKGQKLLIGGLAVIAMTMIACTKDAPFKTLPKSKELVDLAQLDAVKEAEFRKISQKLNADEVVKGDWLSVTSYGKSSRSNTEARPYWMGSENLVRFVKTKDSLVLTTLEEDSRFEGNTTNHRAILSIPARYVEYRCAADAFGECTNSEEENNDVPWEDRKLAELDFGKAEFLSQEVLPIELKNLFDGCFAETKSDLTGLKIEDGALNIQLEKTFRVTQLSPDCLGKAHGVGISDLSFRVQYSHSMVKMDKLISSDYQRIYYPGADEFTFGFFTTTIDKLAIDNRDVQNGFITYMNRWSPARKVIPYHMSNEFFKPENKLIMDATQKAVDHINTALSKSGSELSINLSSEQGMDPNDLRNNTIVLVEDPASSGVIGYGPSVANPRTGEIVHARTVMYGGVIKQLVNRGYEEVRLQIHEEDQAARDRAEAQAPNQDMHNDVPHWGGDDGDGAEAVPVADANAFKRGELTKPSVMKGFEDLAKKFHASKPMTMDIGKHMHSHEEYVQAQKKMNFGIRANDAAVRDLLSYKTDMKKELSVEDKVKYAYKFNDENANISQVGSKIILEEQLHKDWSKDCFYDGVSASLSIIKKVLRNREEVLRPWSELADSEKQEIIDLVMPEIWITTLVHELGHNLGLRHNFAGSEDKQNFYTKEELADLGIEDDEQIPYASMMEYTYRTVGALPTLGKYDIAALKFAYERKIDLADGRLVEFTKVNGKPVIKIGDQVIPVPEKAQTIATLEANGLDLKPYKYCTDDMVGINPGCKRFDEGSTYSEIASHLIKTYNDMYRIRYKRNDRREFSLIDEGARASRTAGLMMDMRVFFEVFERIKNQFGLAPDAPEWKEIPFLADLRQATGIAGRFLTNVMLTPDIHCTIGLKDDPKTIVEVVKLKDINSQFTSCFDPQLKDLAKRVGEAQDPPEAWIISGQGGKSFQSLRDQSNPDPSVDQIDVQGVWADKLIAQQMLFGRKTGMLSLDKSQENFLSVPELRGEILGTLAGVVTDEVRVPVEFRNELGVVQSYKVKVTDPDTEETHEEIRRVLPLAFSLAAEDHIVQEPIMRGLGRALGLPPAQTNYRNQVMVGFANQIPSLIDSTMASNLLELFRVVRSLPANVLNPAEQYLVADVGGDKFASRPRNTIAHTVLVDIRSTQVMSQLEPIELLILALSLEPTEETAAQYTQRAAELFRKVDRAPQAPTAVEITRELGFNAILRFVTDDMITEAKGREIIDNLL